MGLFYDIKSKVISFFSDIRIYWCGIILFGDSHYKFKGADMRYVLDTIKPGDVLLRRYSHYLGSIIVPGHFSHAAFYPGNGRIIHMLGGGIEEEDILTFMRCDDIAIIRPPELTVSKAIEKAENYLTLGIDYDFDFDFDSPAKFVCTEFVDALFDYPVKEMIGDKAVMPDNFLDSGFFTVV